jgi:hypothetical protein
MASSTFALDAYAGKFMQHFGAITQRIKAIEELSECTARLAKDAVENYNPKNSGSFDVTVEEIADATIMLRQMRLYYGAKAVDEAIERKVLRTDRRIDAVPE